MEFEKILDRIRKLQALADDPAATPSESERARERIETYMREYRIQEEQLLAQDPQSMKPEMVIINLVNVGNEFQNEYYRMWYAIERNAGIRSRLFRQDGHWSVQAVGYASDIKFADVLYTSARLVFSGHLQPIVDPTLSEEENIYRLRSAGLPRGRVAAMLWGSENHQRNLKVAKVYKAECEKRGEVAALSGRGISAKTYRETYAEQFAETFRIRLRNAQMAADRVGGAVTLHGRTERVDEAFYNLFPEERPTADVEPAAACQKCAKTKHTSGKCQSHRPRSWTQSDEANWHRRHESPAALSGRAAGKKAAEKVGIDSKNAQRLDSYTAEERQVVRVVKGIVGQ